MSASEVEPKIVREFSASLYEILVGEDSWVVLSNSYGEVAKYIDVVFRLSDLSTLKITKIEVEFALYMDIEIGDIAVSSPMYLASVRDNEDDSVLKVLANSIDALLSSVDEEYISNISIYAPRVVILPDVKVLDV